MSDLRILRKVLDRDTAGTLLESFEERRSDFAVRLRRSHRDRSENTIHKLRVASRKLLAILETLEVSIPRKDTADLRKLVRACLKSLGPLRDAHVHIEASTELARHYPQIATYVDDLERRERKLRKRCGQTLDPIGIGAFGRKTDKVVDRFVDAVARESDDTTRTRVAGRIGQFHTRTVERLERVDPQRPQTIHRMRVAFKKFRYAAEIAAPMFDQISNDRLSSMQAFQSRTGRIQDIDTLLQSIMRFRERSGCTSLLLPENELRRRRRAAIEEFMNVADEVRFFWRGFDSSGVKGDDRRTGEAG